MIAFLLFFLIYKAFCEIISTARIRVLLKNNKNYYILLNM